MQKKTKDANFIIQHMQLKPTHFTTKHVTKDNQRIAEMETHANFRQYAINNDKKYNK